MSDTTIDALQKMICKREEKIKNLKIEVLNMTTGWNKIRVQLEEAQFTQARLETQLKEKESRLKDKDEVNALLRQKMTTIITRYHDALKELKELKKIKEEETETEDEEEEEYGQPKRKKAKFNINNATFFMQ